MPTLFQVGWAALIVLVVVPWGDFQASADWAKVSWIPFDRRCSFFDELGNVLLYLPIGFMTARSAPGARAAIVAVAAGAALLSVGTEVTQLFSHYRFPSTTDVLCNVLGACAGGWLARLPDLRSVLWAGRLKNSPTRQC